MATRAYFWRLSDLAGGVTNEGVGPVNGLVRIPKGSTMVINSACSSEVSIRYQLFTRINEAPMLIPATLTLSRFKSTTTPGMRSAVLYSQPDSCLENQSANALICVKDSVPETTRLVPFS